MSSGNSKIDSSRALLCAAGGLVVVASVFLAVVYEYKHFYEVLVGGLAVMLAAALGSRISWRTYTVSYFVFLLLALIGDLLFGLIVTKLWHYNYSHLIEYAVLYGWTYPIAGIVMFQSYVLARQLFKPRPSKPRESAKVQNLIFTVSAVALLPLTAALLMTDNFYVLGAHFACITIFFLSLFGRIANRLGKTSLLDDMRVSPAATIGALLITTYANLLLHEIPNTWAREWVYTNLPWQSAGFLGVPAAVYPGWLALSLLPIAWLYAAQEIKRSTK